MYVLAECMLRLIQNNVEGYVNIYFLDLNTYHIYCAVGLIFIVSGSRLRIPNGLDMIPGSSIELYSEFELKASYYTKTRHSWWKKCFCYFSNSNVARPFRRRPTL